MPAELPPEGMSQAQLNLLQQEFANCNGLLNIDFVNAYAAGFACLDLKKIEQLPLIPNYFQYFENRHTPAEREYIRTHSDTSTVFLLDCFIDLYNSKRFDFISTSDYEGARHSLTLINNLLHPEEY